MKLKDEGDTREQVRVRVACDHCENPATRKHTFLLPGARGNPASSAYGRDDCSWCEDAAAFSCEDPECLRTARKMEGFEPCAEFRAGDRFSHMFLTWEEKKGSGIEK